MFLKSLKFSNFSSKRFKTEMIEPETKKSKGAQRYTSNNDYEVESKSLQKSN